MFVFRVIELVMMTASYNASLGPHTESEIQALIFFLPVHRLGKRRNAHARWSILLTLSSGKDSGTWLR